MRETTEQRCLGSCRLTCLYPRIIGAEALARIVLCRTKGRHSVFRDPLLSCPNSTHDHRHVLLNPQHAMATEGAEVFDA